MSNADVQRFDPERQPPKALPMQNLTRIQKRYVLEPVFTAVWVTGWVLSAVFALLAIWTDAHGRFILTAVVLFAVGGISAIAKGVHQDANVATEGTIERRSDDELRRERERRRSSY